MKKRTKVIFSVCLALFLIIGVGGYAYVSAYYPADETALAAISYQTGQIQIEQDGDVIWFLPEEPTVGLIFYPGGKMGHTAYAPLLRSFAENEILCALVRMPGNLAVLNANAADGLREKHPEITTWYIAGHSLGGAMAANYAAAHSEDYGGLILLAAYSTKDLSWMSLRVLSVYGSEDGVLNRDAYKKYWANLPADTTEIILDDGCHAQSAAMARRMATAFLPFQVRPSQPLPPSKEVQSWYSISPVPEIAGTLPSASRMPWATSFSA